MRGTLVAIFVAILIILLWVVLLQQKDLIVDIRQYIETGGILSYFLYVLIVIASATVLPLSAIPLIPLASSVMGPLPAALLGIVGWTIGATIAFLLARHYGRRVLEQYISLDKIDALLALVPKKNRFLYIVLFRFVLPTDLANYALGLAKSLGFVEYFLATFIAIVWYSFLLSYLGHAVLEGNFVVAVKLLLALLVIFSIGWYVLRRSKVS